MKKIKILTVFGTRPEVIKLAPFIQAVRADSECLGVTCATTQHRELQNDILNLFKIKADYDLDIMQPGQDLSHVMGSVLARLTDVLRTEQPDVTVVQGDTTTAFSAALASFYQKVPVVHIEAGLRTGKLFSPFPEEANRTLISRIAQLHMAPTQTAVTHLQREGITQGVFHVGNTIVDAVHWILSYGRPQSLFIQEKIAAQEKKILITVHRRENFGEGLKNICTAIAKLCKKYAEYTFIWPIHPNPQIKPFVEETMRGISNLYLLEPLSYSDLVFTLNSSSLILSDSGGIQEEAFILKKNIIILREDTERPEVVALGYGVLTGSDPKKIGDCFDHFIQKEQRLSEKKSSIELYGMPGVSSRILSKIKSYSVQRISRGLEENVG